MSMKEESAERTWVAVFSVEVRWHFCVSFICTPRTTNCNLSDSVTSRHLRIFGQVQKVGTYDLYCHCPVKTGLLLARHIGFNPQKFHSDKCLKQLNIFSIILSNSCNKPFKKRKQTNMMSSD